MMIGGVTVRATTDIDPDLYAISLPNGGPPLLRGHWSEGPALVAPGHVLVVAVAVYERLIRHRATTRFLPASGWTVFDPRAAPKRPSKRKRYR